MNLIAYADSYHYYGLWEETMGYFDEDGKYKILSDICKTTDVYNCCGTKDSMTINISIADNLSIDRLAYINFQRSFNNEKVKENIEIVYYSKGFEKIIPAIMKNYSNKNCDVKITFLYNPTSEKELFDEENALGCAKELGWFDEAGSPTVFSGWVVHRLLVKFWDILMFLLLQNIMQKLMR